MKHTDSPSKPTAVAIIPARYSSIRLPGKPLLQIAGRPMIVHVVERALAAHSVVRAIVATDDRRIRDAVREAGFEAVMTSPDHRSGSDRLAEVAAALDDAEMIVNVQGDEPLIAPETVDLAVNALVADDESSVATTSEIIETPDDVLSADVVKVVTDERGRALYFSRSPVPYPREAVHQHGSLEEALLKDPALLSLFRKHTGLYVYRRRFLLEYARWSPTPLERAESLEQLRMLERGAMIRVVETPAPSIGVDTAADLERVREIYESKLVRDSKKMAEARP
ncbi:MAG: 3-deoxy-manno-octulosonate cytidylyltransferase [Acidobacteriota bacterium]|nr:3-deoxy-manno-octulosonate cytidylyltransferase [Acidobacteriota bacterium]